MFKKLILAITLLMSFQAFAETTVWMTGTVKILYPSANGNFIVIFNEPPTDCTNPSKYYNVTVGQASVTEQGAAAMLSTAMAAGMANKTLKVNFDKDSASCFINRMQLIF